MIPTEISLKTAGKSRYGLIAGWGNYPLVLAKALKASGAEVVCLGVLNHADPSLASVCDVYEYMGLAKFGAACRFFRRHGVSEITLAGEIYKDYLLAPGFLWRQLPDWYTLCSFFPVFFGRRRNFGNDALLLAAVETFARRGIRLVPGTDLAPELLVTRRLFTKKRPTQSQWDDIRCAWPILRELGRLDISQTIAVADRKILAVEGVDGTDETLKRAAVYAKGGFVVLKAGKPNQDMRFDVPAIGLETLKTMVRVGASLLAVEAKKSFFIEPEEKIVEFCDSFGLALLAITEEDTRLDASPF